MRITTEREALKIGFKVWLDNNGKAFGDGPYELLRQVEVTRSLHQAANQMGMSYSKAWGLIRTIEKRLGIALLERKVGGQSGGGSQITPKANILMRRYERFRADVERTLVKIYQKHFSSPLTPWLPQAGIPLPQGLPARSRFGEGRGEGKVASTRNRGEGKRRSEIKKILLIMAIFLILVTAQNVLASSKRLLMFAGAASKPATEEAVKMFQERSGVIVDLIFGGSGFVLSQMKLGKKGDLYFPGSSDFMEVAKREGLVFPDSEKIVVYLIPAINVQKGNPKKIYSLIDLTKDGVRIAIANPEMVCVGTYAVEIIEKNFNPPEKQRLKKNLVNYTESCEKTANVISLRAVDAVLGWRVFHYWDPERIETIYLRPEEIPRIGYLPIAISKLTQDKALAQKFVDFLLSTNGKAIFRKYHYLMDLQEAQRFAKPDTPVGGEYVLPNEWRTIKK
jgi:molybdate transport system substrate-binding protein